MKKVLFLLMLFSTMVLNAQDVIVKTDGSTIICKVIEVGTSEVKYKKFSNMNGPIYSILATDIQNINFENGEKEFIDNNFKTAGSKSPSNHGVVLNYGTEFPIQIESPVRAKDVSEGQYIYFKTMIDIDVDGVKVIRAGAPVTGIVYKAKRSSWWGTKGKLGIRLDHLTLPDGTQIPVKGDIYVTGKNRTALSVLLFLFVTWPACFICGSKAELPYGFDAMAKIGASVQFSKNGKPIITNNINAESVVPSHLYLSSLKNIPPLPCYATIADIGGYELKVQIVEIDINKGIVKYKKLNKKGKPTGNLYHIEEYKLKKIDFGNDTNNTAPTDPAYNNEINNGKLFIDKIPYTPCNAIIVLSKDGKERRVKVLSTDAQKETITYRYLNKSNKVTGNTLTIETNKISEIEILE